MDKGKNKRVSGGMPAGVSGSSTGFSAKGGPAAVAKGPRTAMASASIPKVRNSMPKRK